MSNYKKIQELLNEGSAPREERRPNFIEAAYEGLDTGGISAEDPSGTKPTRPTVTGKPKKGVSNPLRAGDQSTII